MEKYLNPALSPKERAADLLDKMSVREKMAQVQCVLVPPGREEAAAAYCAQGIGEISTLEMRRMTDLDEAAAFQRRVQTMVMEQSPHRIPAIFHMEGLCGAFLPRAASLPSGIGRASSWDPALEEKLARIVARQENAVGITHTLAPVLDISRDSRMGRQGETYGESPTLAAAMGMAYTKGVQETAVDGRRSESIAKHFMGFHNSEGGVHGAASDTPPRLLEEVYGKPFQAAITLANLRGVMPCYCSIDGEAASASHYLLTEVLRERMGFDGVAAADYGAVGNVHTVQKQFESKAEAGLRCMEAGMDVEMPLRDAFDDALAAWFESGKADIEILNTAVRRVLEAKFRMGLFEHPFALEGEALRGTFGKGRDEDRAALLQSARESLVLLKNDGTLPLVPENEATAKHTMECGAVEAAGEAEILRDVGKEKVSCSAGGRVIRKIAVIGPHAANASHFFGGYTHLSMVEAIHAVKNSLAGIGEAAANRQETAPLVPGTQIQSSETEEFAAIRRQYQPDCRSLLEELRARLEGRVEIIYACGYPIAGNDESGYEAALAAVQEADVSILTLGGKHGSCSVASMGEGVDAVDINLPVCQERFIRLAASLGKPLVGVHFNGRPVSSDAADECLNALIEAWNPAEAGAQAIADVLTGVYNPGGKLPVSVAYCAGQIPVYYDHPNGSSWHQGESIGFANYVDLPHTPRYFFGHGLSYTTFSYGDLQCETNGEAATRTAPDCESTAMRPAGSDCEPAAVRPVEPGGKQGTATGTLAGEAASSSALPLVAPDGEVRLSLTVENTGGRAGTEIVQLYVRDVYASMTRPVMELAGFARAELLPGEKKRVTFIVSPSQLAFLDRRMRWQIEAGEMELLVGASSADIRLRQSVRVTRSLQIEGRERQFWAEAKVEKMGEKEGRA